MASAALRQEFRAYLDLELSTATTLGLAHLGLPISSDAIASLFGVAKRHGVGDVQDATRMALRLPAFCGTPTREAAQQVLEVSVATQHAFTAQTPSLIQQRREVLAHPNRLERLSLPQGSPDVGSYRGPKTDQIIKEQPIYQMVAEGGMDLHRGRRVGFASLKMLRHQAQEGRLWHLESKNRSTDESRFGHPNVTSSGICSCEAIMT